jgi:hypothetical protein
MTIFSASVMPAVISILVIKSRDAGNALLLIRFNIVRVSVSNPSDKESAITAVKIRWNWFESVHCERRNDIFTVTKKVAVG